MDREKVIAGLETCKSSDKTCSDCPYNGEVCTTSLCDDVLALLKEQDDLIEEAHFKGYSEGYDEAYNTMIGDII